MFVRDWLLIGLFWFGLPMPVGAEAVTLSCYGQMKQGGLVLCETANTDAVLVDNGTREYEIPVNENGIATIGIHRKADLQLTVTAKSDPKVTESLSLTARDDPFRTIDGLDCDKIDARTEEQKAHASRSWVKKQTAFKTFANGEGARNGFIRPSDGPASSPFGPARKYIGVGKDGKPCDRTSVHQGYDIAIPVGTEIIAPAPGTVTLGDPDLYYEGGTVFLDHGDGLVSVFLHMSEVDVAAGDKVEAGDRLGASGNTGRTSGPHLHWAVKWRNPGTSERGGDFYIDPALLLDLSPAP
ncbi:MAG: M23 family metallopeptidase [Henriciella sp.]|nr:M23 family metallopeptidase [Henriciella sp.]